MGPVIIKPVFPLAIMIVPLRNRIPVTHPSEKIPAEFPLQKYLPAIDPAGAGIIKGLFSTRNNKVP